MVVMCALLALALLVPADALLVYRSPRGRGGRRLSGRPRTSRRCSVIGNSFNPDPFAFPRQRPFPRVPFC